MHVHGSAGIFGGLYLDPFLSTFYSVVRVSTAHNQIGMAVRPSVLGQRARVAPQAGSQQIGEQPGQCCFAPLQDILKPTQSFLKKCPVDVKKQVIKILYCQFEILRSEFEWEQQVRIEHSLDPVPPERH